ncbi:MAG: hypothetical protein N5P05_000037 [Chroococcopsis gigantea SAG 12.99]|jgi:hypothetical protein|nr:hormogonium polysaccharide biosynthesis protein HpsL [Chlorogloea purpurea SAG 13.99]MDV2998431.1 hypothetical protein [Chroococcopsis gigantea SAG 12.99]
MTNLRWRKKQTKEVKKSTPNADRVVDKKELAIKKRETQEKIQKLITVASVSIFLGVIFAVPVGYLTDNFKYGIMTVVAVTALILSYFYPRTSLWTFLVYLPFNGTVVYWLGDGNTILQISKDVLYFPALIRLVVDCKKQKQPILVSKVIIPGLAIFLTFALLTFVVVNVQQQFYISCDLVSERWVIGPDGRNYLYPCREGSPVLGGLLGLKVLIGYIPLIFCTYYLIKDINCLRFMLRLMVTVAIIACVLGIIQFWFLRTGICQGTRGASGDDLYKATLAAKCFVGGSLIYSPEVGMIRLPGTFVSPWHWGWFLVSNAIICFAASFSEVSKWWRSLGILALSLVFINAVICGQRLAFIAVPLIITVLIVLTGQITNFKRFIPIAIVVGILLAVGVLLVNPDFAQQRLQSAINRWNNSPPLLFIQQQIEYSTDRYYSFLGWGLGKATSSARVFWPVIFLETFFAKLIYEMGYVGFVAFLIFITSLVYATFMVFIKIRDPNLRTIGGSFWLFMVIVAYVPYWYPLDTDPVGIYYWTFAGVIFRIPVIEKQQKEQALAQSDNPRDEKKLLKLKRKNISLA